MANQTNDEDVWGHYNTLQFDDDNTYVDISNLTNEVAEKPKPKPVQQTTLGSKYKNNVVGFYEDKPIDYFVGRYGPCLKYDNKFYSIDKNMTSVSMISEEYAINVIVKKNNGAIPLVSCEADVNGESGKLSVVQGPYGYYIKFTTFGRAPNKQDNYYLPHNIKNDIEKIKALKKNDLCQIVEKIIATR
jgi:hypothetical protein